MAKSSKADKSQVRRFREAARELGYENAFDQALRKVATAGNPVAHKSDCAVHDAPAYKAGACTCARHLPQHALPRPDWRSAMTRMAMSLDVANHVG